MAQLYAQAAPPYARRKSKFKEIVAMNDKLFPDRFKIFDDIGAVQEVDTSQETITF